MEKSEHMLAEGLLIGKFMPPTMGHKFLVEAALAKVERLTVLVGSVNRPDLVPVEVRRAWLERHFSERVKIVSASGTLLDGASGFAERCRRLRNFAINAVGRPPDAVFASETYGRFLAELLDCKFEMVDPNRSAVPISSTMVRRNPARYWNYILPEARPSYLSEYVLIVPDDGLARVVCKVRGLVPKISCLSTDDVVEEEFFDYVEAMRLSASGGLVSVVASSAWAQWREKLWLDLPGGEWKAASAKLYVLPAVSFDAEFAEEDAVLSCLVHDMEKSGCLINMRERVSDSSNERRMEKPYRERVEAALVGFACLRLRWLRKGGFDGLSNPTVV
ncbi:adenylyltransferase/cytidyltransferase family protein [Sphingobium yanoikuyae]|nr:adenylyltransferase/cytidyltransferase family protein [Sphingobium yanoikuyae]MDH2151203.1 adenylyltransferase/cytidyltransferase family protein [Sphingobium yanoikuyae]MDH2170332.1 adenylyltransferase/cytidyltransferase family protein [Sphingobium yanoikuyae]